LEREEAAQRLSHGWMSANLEGDKVNEAIQKLTAPADN
jgi:hypothetical protein